MGPAKLQPALLGGIVMGVLSVLPFVNLVNACCCGWVLFGGALAAYLMQQNHPAPITAGDGAIVGLLAGGRQDYRQVGSVVEHGGRAGQGRRIIGSGAGRVPRQNARPGGGGKVSGGRRGRSLVVVVGLGPTGVGQPLGRGEADGGDKGCHPAGRPYALQAPRRDATPGPSQRPDRHRGTA